MTNFSLFLLQDSIHGVDHLTSITSEYDEIFFLFRSLLFPHTTPLNIVVDVAVDAAFSSLFILFFSSSSPLEHTQRRICVRQQTPIAISLSFHRHCCLLALYINNNKKEQELSESEREKKTHIEKDKETKNIFFLFRSFFRRQHSNLNSRRISPFHWIVRRREWH